MNSTLGKITSSHPHGPDTVLSDTVHGHDTGSGLGKGNKSRTFLSEKAEPFFDVVTIDEAVRTVRSIAKQTGTETIMIDEAEGRVLAESIITQENIPGFDRSWKDGYAVIAQDTYPATENSPVILSLVVQLLWESQRRGRFSQGMYVYSHWWSDAGWC